MRYRVYDIEEKKEKVVSDCVTPLKIGAIRKVIVKKGNVREEHNFKILEQLPELK